MGPKKTAAQKAEEKRLKDEEEAKAKAAEEARLALEAEKKRIEAEKLAAERRAARVVELERLNNAYQELLDSFKGRKAQLEAEDKKEAEKLEWEIFRNASDKYVASAEKDVNTFISITSEVQPTDMSNSIEIIKKIESLANDVEKVWSDNLSLKNIKGCKQSKEFLSKMQTLILEKLDQGCVQLLRSVETLIDHKYEFHVEEETNEIAIGLWASLADMRPIRRSETFPKLGFQIDIPKQILSQGALVHRFIRIPYEAFSLSAYETDSSNTDAMTQTDKIIVGPLLLMDLFFPTPQPLTLRSKKWLIKDNSPANLNLRKSPYPTSVPCKCLLKASDDIVMTDDVKLCVWNENKKEWVDDGIADYQYSESTRMAQFYTTVLGTFALVRDRCSDFPFKKWSLQVMSDPEINKSYFEQQTRLTIVSKRHEVVIDIIGTMCKLVKPTIKCTSALIGVLMAPGELLLKLQRRGINLIPTEMDPGRIEDHYKKDYDMENQALEQIAHCASAFDFTSSSWNQQLGEKQLGLLARESTIYIGGADTFDYECVLVEADSVSETFKHAPDLGSVSSPKYLLVLGNEYGNKTHFNHASRPDEISHLDLTKAMNSRTTVDAKTRIERTNERFSRTVHQILQLIKPFSMS